jgi:hypothetical protein
MGLANLFCASNEVVEGQNLQQVSRTVSKKYKDGKDSCSSSFDSLFVYRTPYYNIFNHKFWDKYLQRET